MYKMLPICSVLCYINLALENNLSIWSKRHYTGVHMETVKLQSGRTVKMHSQLSKDLISKAMEVIEKCENKEIRARVLKTMGKGLAVLDVNLKTRVVVDTKNNYHCMTHEKYNNFIARR